MQPRLQQRLGLVSFLLAVLGLSHAASAQVGPPYGQTVITLNNVLFRIPVAYVEFSTSEANSMGNSAGVSIGALLPDLTPDLTGRITDARIFIAIERPMRRSASEDLSNWKIGSQIFHVGNGASQELDGGNRIILHDRSSARNKVEPWDMYQMHSVAEGKTLMETIFCNQAKSRPWIRCRDGFLYKGLVVKVRYHRSHLNRWLQIRNTVKQKLDSWSSEARVQ